MSEANAVVIAVGSTNPAKLGAVHLVGDALFRRVNIIRGSAGRSGVSEQPRSDGEAIRGAENRARAAFAEHPEADFAVGIESGVDHKKSRLYAFTWAVIQSRGGREGRGCSGRIQLPDPIAAELQRGLSLDEAIRMVTGETGVGTAGGAMGLLTVGAISRTDGITHALHFAFAPLLNVSAYGM